MSSRLSYKGYLISLVVFCLLVSIIYHQSLKKPFNKEDRIELTNGATKPPSAIQMRVNEIYNQIDQRMPKVTFAHKDNTTSATHSKVFIKNPQTRYCVGDQLTVQVDVYDYLGKRKTYGGDYLRSRISNPKTRAGSSGSIKDFNNGTYHIDYTLFWEGAVVVTVFLIHPSEAVSALWKARNSWYGYVEHEGKFIREGEEKVTKCGFALDTKEELCEYADHDNEEYFYCVKPQNYSCDSYAEFKNWKTSRSRLSQLEASLLDRSNVRVEIPVNFEAVNVVLCNNSHLEKKKNCAIGSDLEYPSGHVKEEIWYPKACTMKTYHSPEELNACLQGKFLYMYGDSTVHQWMTYFEGKLGKTLKPLNLYVNAWAHTHINVDFERNIQVVWKRHGRPFEFLYFMTVREEHSIPREIDFIGGDAHTVIALYIGVHFRFYPVHHFIRRLLNIRRAIERLHLRSPQTKVIIKTENTEMPPKSKAKSQQKKKVKKPKAGPGSVEEQFRKATLEVDILQDHLALQSQVTRQAQQRKQELRGKLQGLQEDIQDERDEKQALYSEMTRQHRDLEQQSSAHIRDLEGEVAGLKLQLSNSQHAFQLLKDESHRITEEKEAEIEEFKNQVESMETEYEQILHSSLDRILSNLALAGQRWAKEALTVHQQYKHMLQDCGLNPLDI